MPSLLVTYPNNILAVDHSKPVDFTAHRDTLVPLLSLMEKTMKESNGIGISAIQIGVKLPLCIVGDYHMLNPSIISTSMDTEIMLEGCLSCPGEFKEIPRPRKVKVKCQNPYTGKWLTQELDGLLARCALHEFDHIRGKLIKDYSANKLRTR